MCFTRVITFLAIFASWTTAWANNTTYVMRATSYFIRSSPDFGSHRNNLVGVLTKDSRFKVLERQQRPDGSWAVRIEVKREDLGRNGNLNSSPTRQYWIFQSNDQDYVRADGRTDTTTTAGRDQSRTCTGSDCSGSSTRQPIPRRTQDDFAAVSREATRRAEEATPTADTNRRPSAGAPTRAEIANYSSSSKVTRMINYAQRNFGHNRRGGGRCYRRVKDSLVAGNLIPNWYSDQAAKNAVHTLKGRGFINLLDYEPYKSEIKKASDAPKGAILVYENIPASNAACRRRSKSCGHIEIKMDGPGRPGYISDYRSATAISETSASYTRRGPLYRLIGVMVKRNP
ncbi:hypothetical protein A11Q_1943 [Pseudobdellovibrio exovorus JSS]|uniref:SCP domain-containing protein n=1 Tax=Pseudobdellovibrio exovorus JSS TaxID=1184267 RepID=M4VSH7_9BACT|nr:hypothetical protein A11Q_1943 [Pseudobdellovibrio exovorus JSS]